MPNKNNRTVNNNLEISKNVKSFSLNGKLKSQQIFTETKNFIKNSRKEKLLVFNDEEKKDEEKLKIKENNEHSSITCKMIIKSVKLKDPKTVNKKNIQEIKSSVKNFMDNLAKQIQDEDKPIINNSNIKETLQKSINNDIKKEPNINKNPIKKFEDKIKSLDQEFFKIKNKIILSLLN
jgi:hypothetical protein